MNKFHKPSHLLSPVLMRRLLAWAIFCWWLTGAPSLAYAQGSFNSGSTGADGAFNPTTSQQVQLPASGVFNYTTVNIPSGVTITFRRNAQNTPVTILATGNVVINGEINVDGVGANSYLAGGAGGPGGFDGGRGGPGVGGDNNGHNGMGPGGGGGARYIGHNEFGYGGGAGFARAGQDGGGVGSQGMGTGGGTYGSPTLIPLIGGSGGGGGAARVNSDVGGSGGGGGGAILVASSGTISGGGSINARGGAPRCTTFGSCGGWGSGGAIRLVANTISGSGGSLQLRVDGVPCCGTNGGAGYIRVEAYDLSTFNPGIAPATAVLTTSTPNSAVPANLPSLRITSVAGVNAPTNPVGSFNGPIDITVPTAQTSPVAVALAATNIPTGTTVSVKVTPQNGAATTTQSSALSGTQASSTATASITLPTGVCLILATTTLDLTLMGQLAPVFIEGEKVRKMEVAATFGGQSEITYITESGKRIKRASE